MAEESRSVLKSFFETGDKPTEVEFGNLIDSFLNLTDDPLHVEGTNIGIGVTTGLGARLDIKGQNDLSSTFALLVQNDSGNQILSVRNDQRVSIGGVTPLARLHIRGEGATSSTSSLLVNNSSGEELVRFRDDRLMQLTSDLTFTNVGGNPRNIRANNGLHIFNASNNGIFLQSPTNSANLRIGDPDQRIIEARSTTAGYRYFSFNDVSAIQTASFGISAANPFESFTIYGQDSRIVGTGVKLKIGAIDSAADGSSILDLVSTTQGFLPPRMTTGQRDAISSPATGLTIYNTTTNLLNFFNGTVWGAV